ncbi:MAG: aminomethyl-transferring glycine dehydrogenase [Pseudomonadales bacterium]
MSHETPCLAQLGSHEEFIQRHIGPDFDDQQAMLATLGFESLDALIAAVVPASIRSEHTLALGESCSEPQALSELRQIASKNSVYKSLIGQGYYNCYTPNVILRNLLENPAWYTAYTPYQPEISQGRLEALLNFQTMVTDLTGMDLANASLLDEATAAAEAMSLSKRTAKSKGDVFFIDRDCLPQSIAVMQTRATPLGIKIVAGDPVTELEQHDYFGVLLQYPGASGEVRDYGDVIESAHAKKALVTMAADILSLLLLKAPAHLGADVAIGSTQRFGVPLGFGGPHAAYMATKEAFKRGLPGRLVGVSVDAHGDPAYRLALQTREQHIRREKATSNICTAQVLLAVIAGMYAVYHGPHGLRHIAQRVQHMTSVLAAGLEQLGFGPGNATFFDTLTIATDDRTEAIHVAARAQQINLREVDSQHIGISLDETVDAEDVQTLWRIFATDQNLDFAQVEAQSVDGLPAQLLREHEVLTHPVFNSYHSETEMMRYLRRLADKDIALDRAMIPLGSCTMKLNAATEMLPISWPEFSAIHPFVPPEQAQGYAQMIAELQQMLCACTGYDAVSLQPNAGSQGEYAGLLAISAYHASRGEDHRHICLIPGSAHGTNPASAQMCGMQVIVVKTDEEGNVDLADLRVKAEQHSRDLAAIMVTYPSTHGVFEEQITEVCQIIHDYGGQVYLDGANLNAMVGLCEPGKFGADVSHLNLHKTFCIPHGGGGPGVGPIGVGKHLAPFLPGHETTGPDAAVGPVAAAAWGSASILPISWSYIKLMGRNGLKQATEVAILNANYVAKRLAPHFPILYTGANGLVAHECIVDLRSLKESSGISVEDVAKRLVDFGFHAPTMSWPVAGTFMIEPTESESRSELDRFCDAMICIREEIAAVQDGKLGEEDNPLKNAPHTAARVCADDWQHAYSRAMAAYPLASLRAEKYWAPVGRIDNVYGDRNLQCSCPALSDYE